VGPQPLDFTSASLPAKPETFGALTFSIVREDRGGCLQLGAAKGGGMSRIRVWLLLTALIGCVSWAAPVRVAAGADEIEVSET